MPVPFSTAPVYKYVHAGVACAAVEATDAVECTAWLSDDVRKRVFDTETVQAFEDDLVALKADGFNIDALEQYLEAPEPDATLGDIGEGIADLFLMERLLAHLPTNRRRDLRSAKGSLPGADIVGFFRGKDGELQFLFGEVKASSQVASPPSVMAASGDGMPAQLERLATSVITQRRLLMYLKARCKAEAEAEMYRDALIALSEGRFGLVGVLVRDTTPQLTDVKGPAESLGKKLPAGQQAAVHVLHLCVQSSEWPKHCAPATGKH